jgi:hypothetical protein
VGVGLGVSRRATRRDFLRASALGGAALVLRVPILLPEEPRAAAKAAFAPNKWITIDGQGAVALVASRAEMGQGVRTALAMILAEELEADWKSVTVVTPSFVDDTLAPPGKHVVHLFGGHANAAKAGGPRAMLASPRRRMRGPRPRRNAGRRAAPCSIRRRDGACPPARSPRGRGGSRSRRSRGPTPSPSSASSGRAFPEWTDPRS